jgi:hypothetical protein
LLPFLNENGKSLSRCLLATLGVGHRSNWAEFLVAGKTVKGHSFEISYFVNLLLVSGSKFNLSILSNVGFNGGILTN